MNVSLVITICVRHFSLGQPVVCFHMSGNVLVSFAESKLGGTVTCRNQI